MVGLGVDEAGGAVLSQELVSTPSPALGALGRLWSGSFIPATRYSPGSGLGQPGWKDGETLGEMDDGLLLRREQADAGWMRF